MSWARVPAVPASGGGLWMLYTSRARSPAGWGELGQWRGDANV